MVALIGSMSLITGLASVEGRRPLAGPGGSTGCSAVTPRTGSTMVSAPGRRTFSRREQDTIAGPYCMHSGQALRIPLL